jgi:hypothetical protein
MFPSFIMSDKASVRILDGELVIFQEFIGHDKVAVNVGGRNRVLARAEWRALPADYRTGAGRISTRTRLAAPGSFQPLPLS